MVYTASPASSGARATLDRTLFRTLLIYACNHMMKMRSNAKRRRSVLFRHDGGGRALFVAPVPYPPVPLTVAPEFERNGILRARDRIKYITRCTLCRTHSDAAVCVRTKVRNCQKVCGERAGGTVRGQGNSDAGDHKSKLQLPQQMLYKEKCNIFTRAFLRVSIDVRNNGSIPIGDLAQRDDRSPNYRQRAFYL